VGVGDGAREERVNATWPGALAAAVLVCTRPRATIRAIVDSDPRRYVVPLVLLAALLGSVGPGRPRPWGTPVAVLLSAVAVPVVYGLGWTFAVVGRWLGGRGDAAAVRAALAWSQVPAIFAFLVRLALLVAFGPEALEAGFLARVVQEFTHLATLWVWGLGIVTVAEVHRFSLVRAFVTTCLGSLVFALPVALAIAVATAVAMLGGHVVHDMALVN
jgi:hypothetical protein